MAQRDALRCHEGASDICMLGTFIISNLFVLSLPTPLILTGPAFRAPFYDLIVPAIRPSLAHVSLNAHEYMHGRHLIKRCLGLTIPVDV